MIILSDDSALSTSGESYDDGIYYVYVRSIDTNGYASSWTDAEIVKLDNTKPAKPEINRVDYNTFNYTTSDNVAVTQYIAVPCVTSDSNPASQCIASVSDPSLADPSWTTVQSQDISTASTQVWFVYARDEAGNISDYETIESFKVSFMRVNTNMTAKYESDSGSAITLSGDPTVVYVLNETPVYIDAEAKTGYKDLKLTWNGNVITNPYNDEIEENVEIKAEAATTGPTDLEVHKKTDSYKHIEYSANDDIKVDGYYVTSTALNASAPTAPSADASGWTTSTVKEVTSAGTYWVWAKDEAKIVTGPVSINVYTVSQGTNTNATSVAKYESESGTAWSASNNYAVAGTELYVTGTANPEYTMYSVTCGSTTTLAVSAEHCTINSNTSFSAKATDQTPPSMPTITRVDYNTFSYSATDNIGVTGYYISKDSAAEPSLTAPACTAANTTGCWTTNTSFDISGKGTYRVWVRDAAGNTNIGSITAYEVSRGTNSHANSMALYDRQTNTPLALTVGQTMYFKYHKDSSQHSYNDEATFSNMQVTLMDGTVVNITASNIHSYFDVNNSTSYYFAGSGSTFTSNNKGVHNSDAETTLTAKYNFVNISFNYSYSSETNYDKLTVTVAGTTVANGLSGSTTTLTYSTSNTVTTENVWSSSKNYALEGTPLYVHGTSDAGYTITNVVCGSTSGSSSPQNCVVNGATTFYAQATDQTAPTVTITRTAYNSFNLRVQDLAGVTAYCVVYSTSSANSSSSCSWTSVSTTDSTYPYTLPTDGAYYWHVYARDAAGNVSAEKNIQSYYVKSQTATYSTLNVRLENSSGTAIALGSYKYALAGTPIYVSASANSGYRITSLCYNSSTSACSSNNITSGTTVSLSSTMYIHAKAELYTMEAISTMQQMTSTICSNTASGYSKNLTDVRDGHIYVVKKLGDGNCWMIQNLALFGDQTINSTYSNVSSDYTLPSSVTKWDASTANIYKGQLKNVHYTNADLTSVGSYYNFSAITAGTFASSNNSVGTSMTYDICAKGWHIPSYNEATSLASAYSGVYTSDFPDVKTSLFTTTGATSVSSSYLWTYLWERTIKVAGSSGSTYGLCSHQPNGSLSSNSNTWSFYKGIAARCRAI